MTVAFSSLPSAFSSGGPTISLWLCRGRTSIHRQNAADIATQITPHSQQHFGLQQVFSQQGSVEEVFVSSMIRHRTSIRPPAVQRITPFPPPRSVTILRRLSIIEPRVVS